jgi:drug/metabolite transporter (DMT)-like permease
VDHTGRRLFARKGLALGALTGAIWGLDGTLLGIVLSSAVLGLGKAGILIPLIAAAMHDGFAALCLFAYNCSAGKWKEIIRTLKVRPGRVICVAALLGGPVGMTAYLLGISNAGSAYAMSVTAIYPAIGSLLAMILLKEKISTRSWMGIALCVVGAIVVGCMPGAATATHHHFGFGIICSLIAALAWGGESFFAAKGMDLVDPDIAINIRQCVSFFCYAFIILAVTRGTGMLAAVVSSGAVVTIAAAGLCGAVSYLTWYRAMNIIGVGRAMALSITYVFWGIIWSALLTGMHPAANLLAGGAMVLAGAVLVVSRPGEILSLRENCSVAETS